MHKDRVLFICNHNSARSQIAEACLRQQAGDRLEVDSGGYRLRPINPLVVEIMREYGIDLSGKEPQSVFDLYRSGRAFQYVITVCAKETEAECPIFPGVHNNRLRVEFPDPSTLTGSHEEQLQAVRKIRDDINTSVREFVDWFDNGATGLPGPRWHRD